MKTGILHDDKKIEEIANKVANTQFNGTGGLTQGIYLDIQIATAKAYADSLFEDKFKILGLAMKLSQLQSDIELMKLYFIKQSLSAVINSYQLDADSGLHEVMSAFIKKIDEHFLSFSEEEQVRITNFISDTIKKNYAGMMQELPEKMIGMIDSFIIDENKE
jgi:uncharacterized membrane-anchored protein YjiN (DUF445 family)